MNSSGARVEPFYAVEINRLANERSRRGLPVIHMEVGQPSAGAPRAAIEAGQRALAGADQGYWESSALKQRIAALYGERYGLGPDSAQVILTMGASGALLLALAVLFERGSRVALARPGYPAHRNVLRALGLEPQELDCGPETRFQPTAGMIAALEPAPDGLILTSPSNPTGTMLERGELQALAAVCRARGIRVISDETYHGITFGRRAHSMLEFETDSVVINSFSKYWCMTGWRLGWAMVPADLVDAMNRYSANMFLAPPTLAQHVALVAMDEQAELEERVATYAKNRQLLVAALPELGIKRMAPVDGAFYIYADVSHLTGDSLAWCRELLDATGLALNTGRDFDSIHGGNFIRMSFAVSTPEILKALELLGGWLHRRSDT
jgi:aspartate/methionine/tyrosine aminotransferase